ncbi:MAG: epimerase, partial [Candidatus Marinimicrobia bacterium]|nr:epimerase [Candidatus Neomarinimicrobiota bacterium]
MNLPGISDVATLEDALSRPYPEDIAFAGDLSGDLLVLGAGGKMGPTLVQRICRAREAADQQWTVYAVSRYSDPEAYQHMERVGAKPIQVDLLDEAALTQLPDCPNIIYMTGMKFGITGQEPLTWAVNSYLPGRIAEQFPDSRIMAFSTGNVYPLVPVASGGSQENDSPDPVGEYAQSCL